MKAEAGQEQVGGGSLASPSLRPYKLTAKLSFYSVVSTPHTHTSYPPVIDVL